MNAPLRVLIVDDSESDAKLIGLALRAAAPAVETERVDEAEALRTALQRRDWDAVVCDWGMPKFSALGALEVVKQCLETGELVNRPDLQDHTEPHFLPGSVLGERICVGF